MVQRGIQQIVEGAETWMALEKEAQRIAARVQVPSKHRVWVKRGKGPKGAFAQVILEGPAAIAIEFGTRRSRAVAPLRRALRGGS